MTKMAFNPLPWFLTADGFHPELAPPLEERLRQIKLAGYDGVHAEIPEATTVAEYRALLDDAGLLPAPGYFQWAFNQPDTIDNAVSKASTDAAQHAELGLDRMFLADAAFAPERFATPSRGVDRDSKRTPRIANGIERVARAMVAEGVVPCLHQHVGTWIEAPDEVEQILEIVPDDVLLLGPDTGHLAWAGADVVEFITRHRPRIGAVHLKDIRLDVATQGHLAEEGLSPNGRRFAVDRTRPRRSRLRSSARRARQLRRMVHRRGGRRRPAHSRGNGQGGCRLAAAAPRAT